MMSGAEEGQLFWSATKITVCQQFGQKHSGTLTYPDVNMGNISNYVVLIVQDRQRSDALVVHELESIRNRLVAAVCSVRNEFGHGSKEGLT